MSLLVWTLLWPSGFAFSETQTRLGVLYPAVEEPYYSVFQSILRGIEAHPGVTVSAHEISARPVAGELADWLEQVKVDAVVALGKQGYLASEGVNNSRVIIGALPITPGRLSGISLSPEPSAIFRYLRELAPGVRKIHVVYSDKNAWLIQRAEAAARALGLDLAAYPIDDLRGAVHQYRRILNAIPGGGEAVWLPLDNIAVDDDVILPMVLQAAWEKGFVVFSSKPPHAQRGALFSVLPNHYEMGQRLAEMARTGSPPGVVPLGDLDIAVNLRTAFHLGLRFTPRQQEKFDLVFPSR